jgi:hypothetical protein
MARIDDIADAPIRKQQRGRFLRYDISLSALIHSGKHRLGGQHRAGLGGDYDQVPGSTGGDRKTSDSVAEIDQGGHHIERLKSALRETRRRV